MALVGLLLGALLVKRWAKSAALPPRRQVAAALGAALLLIAGVATARGLLAHRAAASQQRALTAQLAPDTSFEGLATATPEIAAQHVAALRARYPRDPVPLSPTSVTKLRRCFSQLSRKSCFSRWS